MDKISQSVQGYLKIFFRRKWMLIVPAFGGLVLGICTSVLLPRQYKSSTTILVQEGKSDNPLFSKLAVSSTMIQRAQAIRETILGWDSLVKLVKRLDLDQNVKSSVQFENLIAKLRKDIDIRLREGDIIDLSYINENPQRAQAVVKNVTDIFIERNVSVQNRETSDAIKFIEAQLRIYRGKIKSAEIAQLKDKLNALLVDSTEEHPMVKELRAQINKKMEELKKENLEYSEDARLSAETTNPMLEQIKKSLDSITDNTVASTTVQAPSDEKDVYKVLLLDKLDTVMARDVNVNEEIYNSLLQRLETAKITQRLQSSKEGTKYTILDPPRVPLQPIQPNVPLVVFVGLFLGLATGAGLTFLSEFMDKSFLDVQEASHFLEAPLLGAISKINTRESLLYVKERNKWVAFLLGISGILLVSFTIMIKAFLKS